MIRLAIDVDGVLSNFVLGFCHLINSCFPGRITSPHDYQPKSWDGFTEDGIVTKQEYEDLWRVIKNTPSFWSHLEPYSDNIRALRHYLYSERPWTREVYFLTSRFETGGESAQYQTAGWLRTWCRTPETNVIVVGHMEDKRRIANVLKFTALIDDNLDTVYDLHSRGFNATLLDRTWNQGEGAWPRVRSLDEWLTREGYEKPLDTASRP